MTAPKRDGAAFVQLMRHYVIDYTNRHDQAATAAIMEPDYQLIMGEHVLRGRDSDYHAATARQLGQFPGLGLTVHEIATSGDRLVMRFSEHGASLRHGMRKCAWGGIGLYRWNGRKLTHNSVEQDYLSRQTQLRSGDSHPVDAPAVAPWDIVERAPDLAAEGVVRAWLASGGLAATDGVLLDDQWLDPKARAAPLIAQSHVEIADLFSCGSAVAFHLAQHGALIPDGEIEGVANAPAFLHMAGLVHVEGGVVHSGRIVRNRLDLVRRLSAP